jgi:hypothetical protein
MLPKYDNLSDIFLTMNPDLGIARDFLVVGQVVVGRQGQKRKNEIDGPPIDGGKTKKSINRKKNTRKQTKKSNTKNSRKQTKKSKTKNSRKQTKKIYK